LAPAQERLGLSGSNTAMQHLSAWNLNLYNLGFPKRVSVVSGIPQVVNFTLLPASAGISGVVKDKNGNILSNIYGFAELSQGFDFAGGGIGGPIERGQFSFKAPAGNYSLRIFLSPDTSYTAGKPQNVVLEKGKTISVDIVAATNDSTITGTLQDESGESVTGFRTRVFASSQTGVWQEAFFDQTIGTYSMKVSPGTWYLGFEMDPNSGFISKYNPDVEVVINEEETVIKNLVVRKAGSIIKGQVTDPLGNGVSNAFIGISETSFSSNIETTTFEDPTIAGAETDNNGNYTVAVPPGSYFVKTFVNPERGFINSDEKSITITDGETKTLDLKLRQADLTISGKVFANDIPVNNAFIWGWSETGGYQESFTLFDGSYQLNVTGSDTWLVGAITEIRGSLYKAGEVPVVVEEGNVEHDIYLERLEEIPPPVVRTTSATESTVAGVSGGATVVASGNSITSSGSVSISVTPDVRAPSQGGSRVVGTAYDLEARDETGQLVTSFNSNVTITIPYEDLEVINLGTTEDNLVISFWDETSARWKELPNSIVNKAENTVTAAVDHFTRFAIVAAADITPPAKPLAVNGNALGKGVVEITWSNPTTDFSHTKIYRSEKPAVLGKVLANEVLGQIYNDATALDGVLYYYTVRAVDAAGNETSNTEQVSVTAIGTGTGEKIVTTEIKTTTTGSTSFTRNLKVGSQGADVTALQQFLLDEGVYPEGLITGYFGNLTKGAVIRFQDKYAEDILTPVGLSSGTGYFGPSTRVKMNELLQ